MRKNCGDSANHQKQPRSQVSEELSSPMNQTPVCCYQLVLAKDDENRSILLGFATCVLTLQIMEHTISIEGDLGAGE